MYAKCIFTASEAVQNKMTKPYLTNYVKSFLINTILILKETKKSVSSAEIINCIYNETIVSRDLPSSSVDYN